ncbi:MAG: S10 family peptidase [Imperialibacter sp.]|uniref:S10 family peptidase n=1 Tax=Imperialibacter sp. TaxID=2038411 RepID=UPI0030DD0126|tara:strand:- start:12852 stop:14366 length:1515 start_codon:yes stop_codon:yes gene_type:complete
MMTLIKTILCAFTLIALVHLSNAQKADSTVKEIPAPKSFITQHQGTFNGKAVRYKAVGKETHLKNEKNEPIGALWSVSYLQEGVTDYSKRPVTFIFNGGPGSASVWLHMGFLGPKIVKIASNADTDDGGAPYPLVDNQQCLLDKTDLVFVDPIGTGYSIPVGSGSGKDFWGLTEDASSIAQFIRIWITDNKRWNSPKYIFGESFGTTRAAAVTNALEGGGQHVSMNGLVLISQAIDYQGNTSMHDNLISYLTYLPTMAATAWYHKKAGQGKSLEDFVQECRVFTTDEYAPALLKGSMLTTEAQNSMADKLVYFTGLPKEYVLRSDLRVLVPRFQKKLMEEEGLTVGRLDSRFKSREADLVAEWPTLGDASDYQIDAAYTAALNNYFASVLNVEMDRPYITSNEEVAINWRWRDAPEGSYWEPVFVNVARPLAESMRRNKDLKVLVACGYYDLITPFFDAEYTFARNGIPKEMVQLSYYEGGHMMYNHQPDFDQLIKDIRLFFGN